MWILLEGAVTRTESAGNECVMEATGDATPAFGEVSLLDEQPRQYSFVARGECTLSVLSKVALRECFAVCPAAEDTVLTAVLNKYKLLTHRDFTSLEDKELVDKVAFNLDEVTGTALVTRKEDKIHAVLEVRRRLKANRSTHS
jgi:CRP-like cAMP-binding protein